MTSSKPKLTIVIPAFNEHQAIGEVLSLLQSQCHDLIEEIILVDDGSTDGTSRIAVNMGAKVIRHSQNNGYGAALKTGIRSARTEYVLTMDSDGQHHPDDVRRLWESLDGQDMIIGSREELLHSPLWRMPGKWLLTIMANYLVRQRIPDLNSGLRVFKRETILRYVHLCPSGFSFSSTSTILLLNRGYNVAFVPIRIRKRKGASSVSLRTGLQTLVLILRLATLVDPLRIFIPASLIIGLGGFLWEIPYAVSGRGVSVGSMLAIVTGLLLFFLGLISDQISQLRLERFE